MNKFKLSTVKKWNGNGPQHFSTDCSQTRWIWVGAGNLDTDGDGVFVDQCVQTR